MDKTLDRRSARAAARPRSGTAPTRTAGGRGGRRGARTSSACLRAGRHRVRSPSSSAPTRTPSPVLASLDVRGIPRRFSGVVGPVRLPRGAGRAQPPAGHRLTGVIGGPLRRPHRGRRMGSAERTCPRSASWPVVAGAASGRSSLSCSSNPACCASRLDTRARLERCVEQLRASLDGGARTLCSGRALRAPARERLAALAGGAGRERRRRPAAPRGPALRGRQGAVGPAGRSTAATASCPPLQAAHRRRTGPRRAGDGGSRRMPCRCSPCTRPRDSSSPLSSSSAWLRVASRSSLVGMPSPCPRRSPVARPRMTRRRSEPRNGGSSTWP